VGAIDWQQFLEGKAAAGRRHIASDARLFIKAKTSGVGGGGDAADEGCRPFMRLAGFRS